MILLQRTEPVVALYGSAAANRGGTGVYTRRLIEGFKQAGITGVTPIGSAPRSLAGKLFAENAALPRRVRSGRYNLVHLPAFGGSPARGIRYAVTIHDMAFMANPCWFPHLRALYYRLRFPAVANGASVIIADSDFTVNEIQRYLGLTAERVYLSAPVNGMTGEYFRKTCSVHGRYILFTGTVEPRKNVSALLEAWNAIHRRHPDMVLVIAGRWGWGDSATKHGLEKTPGVRWLGSVASDVLDSATAGAELLVYPSLYEGFGLPPLEAAAAGTPFVLGPAAALKEIYGDVASSFTDGSAESIASEVLNALEKEHSPSDLREFAWGFSLRSTAENTWNCYLKALN